MAVAASIERCASFSRETLPAGRSWRNGWYAWTPLKRRMRPPREPLGVPVAQLSGITHGDCERFSRDFGTALDIEDLVPGTEYLLEVSSPGLDRKLTHLEEYQRFAGQLCKVQTFTPIDGNRHWLGRLGPVEDGILSFVPEGGKPGRKKGSKAPSATAAVSIALTNIEKAQLVPEF
jgi:ribosome maturation factor RimP